MGGYVLYYYSNGRPGMGREWAWGSVRVRFEKRGREGERRRAGEQASRPSTADRAGYQNGCNCAGA